MDQRLVCSLVLLVLAGIVLECSSVAVPQSCNISGIIRDEAPANMCNGPDGCTASTGASCGKANGGAGFLGTDFQLPLGYYKQPYEKGLFGTECNTSNSYQNCGHLGADNTPQYAYNGTSPGKNIQSPTSFYNWFHNTNENIPLNYTLVLPLQSGNTYGLLNDSFWPIDGMGWTDHCDGHNFAFCFEAHTSFGYSGGETFEFTGDDDMVVYIDGYLVIDLGSLHLALTESVFLDDMPFLTKGGNYPLDIFYCERHTVLSDLQITTSIATYCAYTDWCGVCQGNGQSCCTAALVAEYCDDGNNCTVATCGIQRPGSGAQGCNYTTTPCSPVDMCHSAACNSNATCIQSQLNCNDGNSCTIDTCNPSSGCVHSLVPCTPNACQSVFYNSSNPQCCQYSSLPCPANDACTNWTCDPILGCHSSSAVCNAGNMCINQTCNPVSGCSTTNFNCDDGNPCTIDTCIPASGCKHTNMTCPTSDQCTTYFCSGGVCLNTTKNCNDNDNCTVDSCIATSGCSNVPIACALKTCYVGACVNATSNCSYTELPQASCNSVTGLCNGVVCNTSNACAPQVCVGNPASCQVQDVTCNDNNLCTNDYCVNNASSTTGYTCSFVPIPCTNSTPCNPATCQPSTGVCVNQPVVCDDGNLCTQDLCVAVGNNATCTFPPVPCPYTDNCNPQQCNQATGLCQVNPVSCTPPNLCTTSVCANGTCNVSAITCGSTCNPEKCDPSTGECVSTPVNCNDGNPCTLDAWVCNATFSNCTYTTNATQCDDGLACTDDSCNQFAAPGTDPCVHTTHVCAYPDYCHNLAGCNNQTGCVYTDIYCGINGTNVTSWCNPSTCNPKSGCVTNPRVCPNPDIGCFLAQCDEPTNGSINGTCTTVDRPNFSTSTSVSGVLCPLVYSSAVKAAAISAGVVSGIVIGAVIAAALVGVGGKKGYEYLMAKNSPMGNVMGNPIYADSGKARENPLFNS